MYRDLRKTINGAIELQRKNKTIGSSLEASVELYLNDPEWKDLDKDLLENISIVSELKIIKKKPNKDCFISDSNKNIGVFVSKVGGGKCERCWKYYPVLEKKVCDRCAKLI